ncbi:hypothetical protein AAF712_002942 [Marasmius tenuissimus]|uniref:Uncharacterized protein n=1 Tax=Marasmius tenuissimus TaxID=585030 RepID=A0ABR3A962_9AGAR
MVEPGLSNGQSAIVSAHLLELMDLLAKYSCRWKTLSFGPGVSVSHQQLFDQLTADDAPLLERLYAEDSNLFADIHLFYPPGLWNNNPPQTGTPSPTTVANFVSKISSLRYLHLQQGSILTLGFPLGWSRLAELSLNFLPLDNNSPASSPHVLLQTIAQACPALIVLTLRAYLPVGEVGNAVTAVTAPIEWTSLQELNISLDGLFCDYATPDGEPNTDAPFLFLPYIKHIYDCIVTPQLLRLYIQLGHRHGRDPTSDDILPFHRLIKSSPRLMNLQIGGYHILKPEALAQCLQSSSLLDTLILLPERSPSRRRRALGPRPDSEAISPISDWVPRLLSSLNNLSGSCGCPNLKLFDIGRCGEYDNLKSILDFLQSESRISRLKLLKADMGELWGGRALAMTSNASLIETLRTVQGISLDLKWKEIEPPSENYGRRNPRIGLPDNIYDLAMPYP